MTIQELSKKYAGSVILLTVSEIINQGIIGIKKERYGTRFRIGAEVKDCAKDLEKMYNSNYDDFVQVIKRGL